MKSRFLSGDQFSLPDAEEKVLAFWREQKIFEKSLTLRQAQGKTLREKKKRFVFYEGPPYANGKPGIHHILARVFKDIILRYKTMRGYYVPRKAGWDTHGLPVEIAAEKALGLKSKKDIEKFGVEAFNREAKKAVWVYKDEWERMTERIGYWLDLKNAYVTYAPEYIETLWHVLSQIAKRKLLLKAHKVVPWCTRCGTALSSHELAQGYKGVSDNSVFVKFKLKKGQKIGNFTTDDNTYILSWTTTPWTLPGNVALAVGASIKYEILSLGPDRESHTNFIFAADLREKMVNEVLWPTMPPVSKAPVLSSKTEKVVQGKDLVGLKYEPLFPIKSLQNKKSHQIYAADFVTTTDGTGVVHTAVMYGEDDYKLGIEVGLPQHHTVGEDGKFTKEVPGLAGLPVKTKDEAVTKKTEEKILAYLKKKNLLLKTKPYPHEYPFCWRCDTPVIYYARTSWFITMSKLRNQLLENNKSINWVPAHIKEGRFGEWLQEAKDWNLSRERYWGAPLPIWECEKCGKTEVVGSLNDLSKRAGGSRNTYVVMRHGEAEGNIKKIIDSGQKQFHLTTIGKDQVRRAAQKLVKEKFDLIIASDILRTKETAKIVSGILGTKVVFDKRLREIHLGEFTGCHDEKYHKMFPTYESKFQGAPKGGESLRELRARAWSFMEDTEKKYKNKHILLVAHEYPIWMLAHIAEGWSEKKAIQEKEIRGERFIELAETSPLFFKKIPRDETGEVDLHRPYVDAIKIPCTKCKGTMKRVKEVADVWFDSGAMPFAQAHWPFEEKMVASAPPKEYPADYISEAMDQTRGWFYTLLATATALGFRASFKNVVCLGLIADKNGQKMSKSRGNIVEPFEVIGKYGVDAVRWYFYTVNPPGEPKNFDENEVVKTARRFHATLYNSLVFYETYADKSAAGKKPLASKNILDTWILARLNETILEVTKKLDVYEIRDAALFLETFVDDLSRWYIRRSRRRLQKPENEKDYLAASKTLRFVLQETMKLIAPFTPFFAEALWDAIGKEEASVHLADWPLGKAQGKPTDKKLLEAMAEVREVASQALAKRAALGVKVRQPLKELRIQDRGYSLKHKKELLEILKDEVNVKKVTFDSKLATELELDTTITPELKEEGVIRELTRIVQDLRQSAKLKPQDQIALMVEFPETLKTVVSKNEKVLKQEVGAKTIEYRKSGKFNSEISTKLDGADIWLAVRKI